MFRRKFTTHCSSMTVWKSMLEGMQGSEEGDYCKHDMNMVMVIAISYWP